MLTGKVTTPIEHFCTLFDRNYLPLGMTLHQSLMLQAQPFHLWILCMDEVVEQQLQKIALPHATLIPLREVETSALLAVKPGRTTGEYCWTITPFIFKAVFERDKTVQQVTYLDADLFFFDKPSILLNELKLSQKDVLITEHAYAPEYGDRADILGRFCVQFIAFRNTPGAMKVMHWWQERCLEWCFARIEDGKFGDQLYLDCWTQLFANEVYVVQQVEKTLGPWNVRFFGYQLGESLNPVFYHFHSLRIISPKRIQLFSEYPIGKQGMRLYDQYVAAVSNSLHTLKTFGIPTPYIPIERENWLTRRYLKRLIKREIGFRSIA